MQQRLRHTEHGTATERRWSLTPRSRRLFAALVLLLALAVVMGVVPGLGSSGNVAEAQSAAGDFDLTFVAAAPQTYDHAVGGGAYDDGTVGEDKDIVNSLAPSDFTCGDTVTFLTLIEVKGTPPAVDFLDLEFTFDAGSSGQPGVGFTEILSVAVNYGPVSGGDGIGGSDSGFSSDDGGSTATLTGDPLTGTKFTKNAVRGATVRVTDLEQGEVVVIRVDVLLECDPGSSPTGTIKGKLADAKGSGQIPMSGVNALPFPEIDVVKSGTLDDTVVDPSGVANAGDQINYTFTVTNTGNVTLTDVTISDPMVTVTGGPITLAPGADDSSTFTGTYDITQSDIDAGVKDNTATATGSSPGNSNDVADTGSHTEPLSPSPSINILKTGTFNDESKDGSAQVGETIGYTFTVTNTGNVTLSNVTVSDPMVTVTGGPITLAPGAVDSSTFTGTYTLTQTDIDLQRKDNEATATGSSPGKSNDVTDKDDLAGLTG